MAVRELPLFFKDETFWSRLRAALVRSRRGYPQVWRDASGRLFAALCPEAAWLIQHFVMLPEGMQRHDRLIDDQLGKVFKVLETYNPGSAFSHRVVQPPSLGFFLTHEISEISSRVQQLYRIQQLILCFVAHIDVFAEISRGRVRTPKSSKCQKISSKIHT